MNDENYALEVRSNLQALETDELLAQVRKRTLTDVAHTIALEELSKRGVPQSDALTEVVDEESSSIGRKLLRWSVVCGAFFASALVYAVWKQFDARTGGGLLSSFLRGAVIFGFLIWVWRATKKIEHK